MPHAHRRLWRVLALAVAATLTLAACGSGDDETGSGDDTATTAAGGGGNIVKIGVIAPLSGDLSALGLGIRNGVDLAIKEANEAGKIDGWTIELAAEDDTAKPDVGATVAAKLSSDKAVAGVVGTLNSSVAEQVQPVLDKAGVVMVSPANTNPTLTQGADPAKPARPYNSYFRVSTTDAVQGPFAADYASKTLKATNVVIIHDNKTYGAGLQAEFVKRFKANGGKVLGTETVNPGDKDFAAVLSKVKRLNPELIYYGGEYPEASLLSSQAKQQNIDAPLMGGDGIYSGQYIATAKEAAIGDLSTSVGAPVDQLESAKNFVEAYTAAGYEDTYDAYGAYAYDAANVIIDALVKVLPGKDAIDAATLAAIVEGVKATSLEGATGAITFDEFGDTTTKVLTVYKVTAAKDCPEVEGAAAKDPCWKPEETGSFE